MFKTREGGVKGRLNNVQKTAQLAHIGFPKLSPAQCKGLSGIPNPKWSLMQRVADLSQRAVGLVCRPAVLEVSACWGTRVKGGVESRTKVAFSHRSSHAVDRRHYS